MSLTACDKKDTGNPPTAFFSVDNTTIEVSKSIQLTDISGYKPSSWYWEFGDGSTSVEQNPTHSYEAAGNYPISLTVTNSFGSDKITKEDYIEVIPGQKPMAGFYINYNLAAFGEELVFTDTSLNDVLTWSWDFGDGNSSNEQNPTHAYADTGAYTITLLVKNINGETQATQNMTIYYDIAIDPDTNRYGITKIGNQGWFSQNLKTSKFSNGEDIPYAVIYGYTDWYGYESPAFSEAPGSNFYSGIDRNFELLYNYYSVNEGNLCPDGYRVPSTDDWDVLNNWMDIDGSNDITDYKLRAEHIYNVLHDDSFSYWSSTSINLDTASTFFITGSQYPNPRSSSKDKREGISVRCLKDI